MRAEHRATLLGGNVETSTLIIGMGEIGSSLYRLLSPVYPCWGLDTREELNRMDPGPLPDQVDVVHICIRHDNAFEATVKAYLDRFKPLLVDICTTVPPGTCESIAPSICHSTTRGLHPHLEEGLRTITKHIGGKRSHALATYFRGAGVDCIVHPNSRITELLHILNNAHYGINLMFADEAAKLCREYGVDYYAYMRYCETNNDGYIALGHKTKVRPILTPPHGRIGGHCVNMSAGLIPEERRTPMVDMLAKYNEPKGLDKGQPTAKT